MEKTTWHLFMLLNLYTTHVQFIVIYVWYQQTLIKIPLFYVTLFNSCFYSYLKFIVHSYSWVQRNKHFLDFELSKFYKTWRTICICIPYFTINTQFTFQRNSARWINCYLMTLFNSIRPYSSGIRVRHWTLFSDVLWNLLYLLKHAHEK